MSAKTEKKTAKMKTYPVSAKVLADMTGTKEDTVYSVMTGRRKGGAKAKKILLANDLLEQGMNKLVEEVKRVVNF